MSEDDPRELERGYARSRARDEAIRAELQPLGPDERPLGIKLAVALSLLLAAGNLVAVIAGSGESPALGIAFAVGLVALAAGLWARIYLVILAFQALLALSIIVSTLSLMFAGDLRAVALAGGVVLFCAPIFWLLVRVMARLQVPPQ